MPVRQQKLDFSCICQNFVVPLHFVVAKSINDEENILDDGTVPGGHECQGTGSDAAVDDRLGEHEPRCD